jgi:predicted ATPase with chaperone activity
VDRICEREPVLFPDLLTPMLIGKMQVRMGKRRVEIPAEAIVVAASPACGCGAKGDDRLVCTCRPTEARRFQERWRKLLRYPFDLCLPVTVERGSQPEIPWGERAAHVLLARRKMMTRQGKENSRLTEGEVLEAKPWSEKARRLWEVLESRQLGSRSRALSLARVALTISDLRNGTEVEDRDLLEARHYFPEDFSGLAGKRAASSSIPETNSIATP